MVSPWRGPRTRVRRRAARSLGFPCCLQHSGGGSPARSTRCRSDVCSVVPELPPSLTLPLHLSLQGASDGAGPPAGTLVGAGCRRGHTNRVAENNKCIFSPFRRTESEIGVLAVPSGGSGGEMVPGLPPNLWLQESLAILGSPSSWAHHSDLGPISWQRLFCASALLIRTSVLEFRAHPESRVILSRGP